MAQPAAFSINLPILQDELEDPIVLGVREFHVAKALLEGQEELGATAGWEMGCGYDESLSEVVSSQWGPVHLFDLCLRFGLSDTALALALRGVRDCILEDRHLGALPNARDAEPRTVGCFCKAQETCSRCCWGFPLDNAILMGDWDATLTDAADVAKMAAKTPLVRYILDLVSRNETLPFAMSESAARLLDIAILVGNVEAAANLAKTYQARPLRRWRGNELWDQCRSNPQMLPAALSAGADFEGLDHLVNWDEEENCLVVPFLRVVPLAFRPEHWQQVEQFIPLEKNRWPTSDVRAGELFLAGVEDEDGQRWSDVSMQRIRNAVKSGWDLRWIWIGLDLERGLRDASLLDVAVLCGQEDCAELLGTAGVELRDQCLDWHKQLIHGEGPNDIRVYIYIVRLNIGTARQCKSAACAAARASLKGSFQREGSEKGILFKTLAKKFDVPAVRFIIAFAMEAPKIVNQLDLWGDVTGWMESREATGPADGADSRDEEQTAMEVDEEPGAILAEPRSEPPEADVKTTDHHDDLMTALQLSRDQVPVLSMDGVCVFRLSRMATSDHVTRVLLDHLGPLWQLHRRVLEAGCQVDPEWKLGTNPVRALFVPITETQMDEFQALSERGYELTKTDHIFALQSDYDAISKALSLICCKSRPKLQQVRPAEKGCGKKADPVAAAASSGPGNMSDQDEDMDEDEPLLVLESGIRTDSDLHFPSYPMSSGGAACPLNRSLRDSQVCRQPKQSDRDCQESLGELVRSRWGPVHLFDLCLWFGHIDTALALAAGAVRWRRARRRSSSTSWTLPASSNETLPLAMSDEAAARLLDIAILCGNVEAATSLAKTYQARPLRRWRGDELWDVQQLSTLSAALHAGADFEGLHMKFFGEEIPLLPFVALDFYAEQWQEFEQFFPTQMKQLPSYDVAAGELFLSIEHIPDDWYWQQVSLQKIQNALRTGWDLKHIWIELVQFRGGHCDASLLDLAILCGQSDCACALASAGVELRVDCLDWHRLAFQGESLALCVPNSGFSTCQGSALECQSAARAFLTKSFKREGVEKGIALYQTLAKKFHPRGVSLALVHHILGFSTEAHKILDQLDLWGDVKGWVESLEAEAQANFKTSPVDVDVEQEQGSNVEEQVGGWALVPADSDGNVRARHSGAVGRRRAIGGVAPAGRGGRLRGYELTKTDHILALQSDFDSIDGALRQIPGDGRPKVQQIRPAERGHEKKAGPEAAPSAPGDAPDQDEDADDSRLTILDLYRCELWSGHGIGLPAEPQSQRLAGLPAESQRLSGVPAEAQSQRLSGAPAVQQRLSGEASGPSTTKLEVQMASTAAVGGSFEVSPAAASTHLAATTPGGASGPDDAWEDDEGPAAPEEEEMRQRSVGAEATLSAPQIQVKAPEGDATASDTLQKADSAPQVQRASSGISSGKAAAAAATKKASRFTFMGMGRKK
eukprot:s45_g37.t3